LVTKLSRSQIDRLGERLRGRERISDADLGLLQAVREAHDDAMATVTVALRDLTVDGVSLAPTSRLKTVGTILEKLQRESMRLSQMQDIAGARVVIDGGRPLQDRVVNAIVGRFPGSRVVDRRESPSNGYRALHVMVREGTCWVEVQVRTPDQDLWAQIVERLGDAWGRQIRYGDPPNDPEEEVVPGGRSRQSLMDNLLTLSDVIADAERAVVMLDIRETTIGVGELPEETEQRVGEANETVNRTLKVLREALDSLLVSLRDL
jgi:ppGpp synthetase/RelA/SpoT-type nucleotidyltranferase